MLFVGGFYAGGIDCFWSYSGQNSLYDSADWVGYWYVYSFHLVFNLISIFTILLPLNPSLYHRILYPISLFNFLLSSHLPPLPSSFSFPLYPPFPPITSPQLTPSSQASSVSKSPPPPSTPTSQTAINRKPPKQASSSIFPAVFPSSLVILPSRLRIK